MATTSSVVLGGLAVGVGHTAIRATLQQDLDHPTGSVTVVLSRRDHPVFIYGNTGVIPLSACFPLRFSVT